MGFISLDRFSPLLQTDLKISTSNQKDLQLHNSLSLLKRIHHPSVESPALLQQDCYVKQNSFRFFKVYTVAFLFFFLFFLPTLWEISLVPPLSFEITQVSSNFCKQSLRCWLKKGGSKQRGTWPAGQRREEELPRRGQQWRRWWTKGRSWMIKRWGGELDVWLWELTHPSTKCRAKVVMERENGNQLGRRR